jgi:hypothetical protein
MAVGAQRNAILFAVAANVSNPLFLVDDVNCVCHGVNTPAHDARETLLRLWIGDDEFLDATVECHGENCDESFGI